MAATAQSFGREAFEFIEHLDGLSSPAAVGISAAALAGQFGFEWFVFMGLAPQPGQSFDDLVMPDGSLRGSASFTPAEVTAATILSFTAPSPRPGHSNGTGPSMARTIATAPAKSCAITSILAFPKGS
jgi:hypothetical protein